MYIVHVRMHYVLVMLGTDKTQHSVADLGEGPGGGGWLPPYFG